VSSGFAEDLLSAIVARAASIAPNDLQSSITLVPNLKNPSNPAMNCLAVIAPPYHGHFAHWNRDLSSRTLQAYPAYRTDFGGWEPPDLYDELIHTRTPILSWDRPPRPQIWLKVKSSHGTLQGWFDDKFLLADFPDLQLEVPQLKNIGEGLTVRNVANQELHVSRQAAGLFTLYDDQKNSVSTDNPADVLHHLHRFTCSDPLDATVADA
jgi:hypothetical protein